MIYIHVPFCRSFCTYCDFYSELAPKCRKDEESEARSELFGRYAAAARNEIVSRRNLIAKDTNTLYIGGGTPSVLPLPILGNILEPLAPFAPFDEFTIEVNPEDIVEKGIGYASSLRNMGVDRISMGVQSFDDGILRWMNRRHNAVGALEAFRILRSAGFVNISLDFIFGLSQLSDEQWESTISQALALRPEHISAYQLSIENGSALADMVSSGKYSEASDEHCSRQYAILCKEMADAGYSHYEISNFALPGFEARHNSAYWRRVPYVGIGPGAHSLSGNVRSWNEENLDSYLHSAETGTFSFSSKTEILNDAQIAEETVFLALRTSNGIDAGYLYGHSGKEVVDRLLRNGSLVFSGKRIRIPESHFFVSDDIISDLI